MKVGGIPREDELEVSTGLIERNFSNYSAWHYRSTLLDTSDVDVVREELEWVQNAYFTGTLNTSIYYDVITLIRDVITLLPRPLGPKCLAVLPMVAWT